jgi:hypothetical protein
MLIAIDELQWTFVNGQLIQYSKRIAIWLSNEDRLPKMIFLKVVMKSVNLTFVSFFFLLDVPLILKYILFKANLE